MDHSTLIKELEKAVVEGEEALADEAAQRALGAGVDPMALIKNAIQPAMDQIGTAFDCGDVFLPELIRAGDAGKGFAVVANEVRALAQRSAEAAKDIKGLITESTKQVENGVRLVGQAGDMLEKIITMIASVNGMITEISISSEVQASSLQQVNVAVGEMDKMTQQNGAMVEQSTAAARTLAAEAEHLGELVARFKTGEVVGSVVAKPQAVVSKAQPPRRTVRSVRPVVQGNLALKAVASEDDWSEF